MFTLNVLKSLIAAAVGLLSAYGLFIDRTALSNLNLITQFLLAVLLIVMAIQGFKDKEKKNMSSYIYLLGALFIIILGIKTFLIILRIGNY